MATKWFYQSTIKDDWFEIKPAADTHGVKRSVEWWVEHFKALNVPVKKEESFIHVTLWKEPGIGTCVENLNIHKFLGLVVECLQNNTPFQVGHVFGNIDGTHPKRK